MTPSLEYSDSKSLNFFRKLFWNLHSFTWDEFLEGTDYQSEIDEIIRLTEKLKTGNTPFLLDLGCATGNFSISYALKNFVVTGIDYASMMIRKARLNASLSGATNISFSRGNFTNRLGYHDAEFDFVLSAHTLRTRENYSGLFSEIKRVMKKDGCFIVVLKKKGIKKNTPSSKNPVLNFILQKMKSRLFSSNSSRSYNYQPVQLQIEQAGFIILQIAETMYNKVFFYKLPEQLRN